MTDDMMEKAERGAQFIEALGGLPASYALACTLPEAHDLPLADLGRVWYDRWEAEDREWLVVLNGCDHPARVDTLDVVLQAGTAYVVVDDTRLVLLTPERSHWQFDADTGDDLSDADDAELEYWDVALVRALRERLTDLGKDLSYLENIEGSLEQ